MRAAVDIADFKHFNPQNHLWFGPKRSRALYWFKKIIAVLVGAVSGVSDFVGASAV
jgi:hypothetical protein